MPRSPSARWRIFSRTRDETSQLGVIVENLRRRQSDSSTDVTRGSHVHWCGGEMSKNRAASFDRPAVQSRRSYRIGPGHPPAAPSLWKFDCGGGVGRTFYRKPTLTGVSKLLQLLTLRRVRGKSAHKLATHTVIPTSSLRVLAAGMKCSCMLANGRHDHELRLVRDPLASQF